MRKLFFVVLLLMMVVPAWATHQRAAEITYEWKGGNAYEFTLTCYTYTPSLAGVQRDSLLVMWGDGFGDYVPRVVYENLGDDYTLNVYRMVHNYASSGTYVVSMEDPDRNYGVVNVPNSVSVPMYIESELVINPFLGYNNSVQLLNAPVDRGCVGKPFYHHPGAYDPDGDSLSYRLVPCKGANGEDIPGYTYPQASSMFDIDPATGILQWENPMLQGEYNVAILIEEWRQGVKVGSVIRDMQILVEACNNNLPQINAISDTCVVAGSILDFVVSALDPDGDQVTLEASGGPLGLPVSPAVMTPPTDFGLNPAFEFTWQTVCSHIRKTPYQLVIHAKDDSFPIPLSNVHAINITVIGPAVEGLEVTPHFQLTWSPYLYCSNVSAIRVYRRTGSTPYVPDYCETGVRPGYQLIAELPANATSYLDDNGGQDFLQGVDYCYRVVALFHGDAESRPSDEVCVQIPNNQPLMTKVSNDEMQLLDGPMQVEWVRPRDIDPQFTVPFTYRLIRNLDGVESTVYTGADSTFRDGEVQLSEVRSLTYRVEMKDANQQVMGTSTPAGPVMLTGTGGDKTVTLNWTEAVPWVVDSTEVFKKIDTVFVKTASVAATTYTDLHVLNDVTYQYYVRTYGHYTLEGLPRPLVNYSAIIEVKPNPDEPEPEPDQPVYELPNVFTPNDDGINDVFVPRDITPELITNVKMHIFNRWGRTVYDTDDIFINWNGRVGGSGQPCSTGTYFYVCDVEMQTPEGLVAKRLQGSIMIVR
ncbi:MAG: gliding motility-associated C-terminal domain-containing protein [Bacteroidales bacterium]|nr:gliding motility-associated C-terminal domain-containing protein [Bacteroidales bacterium]